MAEPALLDPLHDPFDSIFPGGGAFEHVRYDGRRDIQLQPGSTDDLDIGDDLDFDGDLDFSIADLLDLPEAAADALPPSGEDGSGCQEVCGASSSSSASVNLGEGCARSGENMNALSPDSGDTATGERLVKTEEEGKSWSLKRKKEIGEAELAVAGVNPGPRSSKFRRSAPSEKASPPGVFNSGNEEEEKKRVRLMRNRESAQLSRQRKKHYVEELEEKVRTMHSTITELNGKISFMITENATLRQQLSGGGGKGNCATPAVYSPPRPLTSMHFPWIPCSGYASRPPGVQVASIPIQRLKTQQLASVPKPNKSESKKVEGKSKTKKVASVSLVGLLFCLLFVGVFVPGSKLSLDGSGEIIFGDRAFHGGKFVSNACGRVLTVGNAMGRSNVTKEVGSRRDQMGMGGGDYVNNVARAGAGLNEHASQNAAGFTGNRSEPLYASLYVPRNDKLVKIDGNLIIHSVLASEKATARIASEGKNGGTHAHTEKDGKETSLALAGDLVSALAISNSARDTERSAQLYRSIAEHQRAIVYGSKEKYRESKKSIPVDGPLKEWFREGLEGPVLNSGMCTKVFQFDVSANAGGVVPAMSISNVSDKTTTNTSLPGRMKNRRAMHPQAIPLPAATTNKSEGNFGKSPDASNFLNKSASSVVVSVLEDPREAGDNDGDGVMRPKSISRIFVVTLLDGVKYVTYSCVLPFKNAAAPTL